DLRVVVGKPFLGDARVFPVDPVRLSELDLDLGRSLGLWIGSAIAFLNNFARGLVFAQPAECGMAQEPVGGPRAELDFGGGWRLHKLHPAPRGRVERGGEG